MVLDNRVEASPRTPCSGPKSATRRISLRALRRSTLLWRDRSTPLGLVMRPMRLPMTTGGGWLRKTSSPVLTPPAGEAGAGGAAGASGAGGETCVGSSGGGPPRCSGEFRENAWVAVTTATTAAAASTRIWCFLPLVSPRGLRSQTSNPQFATHGD